MPYKSLRSSHKPFVLIKAAKKFLGAQKESSISEVCFKGSVQVQSQRNGRMCFDISVHSSNHFVKKLIREIQSDDIIIHTHVTFQHFLLRDSRARNGTKFKLRGRRMPVFLVSHSRLTSSKAPLRYPLPPSPSCLQRSSAI